MSRPASPRKIATLAVNLYEQARARGELFNGMLQGCVADAAVDLGLAERDGDVTYFNDPEKANLAYSLAVEMLRAPLAAPRRSRRNAPGGTPPPPGHSDWQSYGESISRSFETAGRQVEARRAFWRALADQLPDGAVVGGWRKTTTGVSVFWTRGRKTVFDLLVEVGEKAVRHALSQHGIDVP